MTFLTLHEYLDSARKMLCKHGYDHNDEDAVAYVAYYMMRADERYDGTTGTRIGFRAINAKFGMMNYYNRQKKQSYSLYTQLSDNMEVIDTVPNDELSVEDQCQFNEIIEYIHKTNTNKLRFCVNYYGLIYRLHIKFKE